MVTRLARCSNRLGVPVRKSLLAPSSVSRRRLNNGSHGRTSMRSLLRAGRCIALFQVFRSCTYTKDFVCEVHLAHLDDEQFVFAAGIGLGACSLVWYHWVSRKRLKERQNQCKCV